MSSRIAESLRTMNIESINQALHSGESLESPIDEYQTALFWALENSNDEIITLLIQNKANLNAIDLVF